MTEGYAEISIPVFKHQGFLLDELTFDAADRYAEYTTVHGVNAWKVSGIYGPIPGLKLRGDYSIAVRAPASATLAHRLMEAGVFRMGTPRAYGGGELDPMSQVRVVEELARIEGSVGWLSMISTAGSFIAAFLEPPRHSVYSERSTACSRVSFGRRNAPTSSRAAID